MPAEGDGPGTVVVGVDGSPASLNALAWAAGQARRQRSTVLAVHARTVLPGLATVTDRSGVVALAARADLEEIAAELTGRLRLIEGELGVAVYLVVRAGDPAGVLAAVAEEVRADALVVGASRSLGHRVAGSVATRLCRNARCPVTVVP
ncbi:universal stress protein [Kineococcus rhizosphaerae]|uniref:Nucleotide-binding universal stress UspA family protein n=1 Tax=Kineococcus rhizosphaerae TaxID=559628 RepID=A0A2T0QY93_9ACTN|nr:universal stress protein [Kineococcus rhizosphaerae]PRY11180.1 nucleotide-binding universal stress UspA family protein [Kineococcus rhizosphaerae]